MLYLLAGINHFWHPHFYTGIIPPYLPSPSFLVFVSGIAEIILALLLIPKPTRKVSLLLIALMLIVFLPVHIYMLHQAYVLPHYRVGPTAAFIRLLVQPLLIIWVMWQRKQTA